MQRRDTSMHVSLLLAVAATTAALEVAVVSLTPPTASEHYGAAGKAWRWKVAVMGEDMALPRPKTALALAESIVERSEGAVQEAATLSTCARLLLIVAGNEDAVSATREACAAQIASYQTRPFDDWRRALDAAGDDIVKTSRAAPTVDDDDELGVFEAATGAEAGAWLARVVAGAADGPTAFDPFSSRKAHVLKQAKQCLEKCRAGKTGAVRDALVRSLEAGKRARDAKTPEVSALRASPRDGGARTAAFSAALNLSEKAGLLLAEDVAQRNLTPERRAALGQERARQDRAKVS
ncbi:unnamed protein product [Pelagomonas calceolata]|uniref:Uncharacterized protein n=1 Tax=Pelagomonas calceolata TaxID=35677 RepID=A0A8J2X525_9STRA|nr:unnamed protein product [Pelagomonas calceolata]|mmetsp:Transcript_4771/g.14399  ORF Transcript_4771/g.14399 Transcript_4771/m.14399 type:complete len:294 (-) Transcript_4771:18-899(-)